MSRSHRSRKGIRRKGEPGSPEPATLVAGVLRCDHRKLLDMVGQIDAADSAARAETAHAEKSGKSPEVTSQPLVQAPTASVANLDVSEVMRGVKAELASALPALINEAVVTAAARQGGTDAMQGLRELVRGELAKLMGACSAVKPPPVLRNNQALTDDLFRKAAWSGGLFGVTPRQCLDLIAQEIRDCILLVNRTPATNPEQHVTSSQSHTSHQGLPDSQAFEDKVDLTLMGAFLHPDENHAYGKVYLKAEQAFPQVGLYNRLKIFAGRTLAEIGGLVKVDPATVERLIHDFEEEIGRLTPNPS
jgi:hypothetical protein